MWVRGIERAAVDLAQVLVAQLPDVHKAFEPTSPGRPASSWTAAAHLRAPLRMTSLITRSTMSGLFGAVLQ
jgi:hypothetical protein